MDAETRDLITHCLASYARKEGLLPDRVKLRVNRHGCGSLEEVGPISTDVIVVFDNVAELLEFFEDEGVLTTF